MMLQELLALLQEGKTLSQYDLAECLHTTPEAVRARLDFLHRAGYLRNICGAGGCGKKCAACTGGCPFSSAPQNGAVLWEAVKQDA